MVATHDRSRRAWMTGLAESIYLVLLIVVCVETRAQTTAPAVTPAATAAQPAPLTRQEQEVIELSRQKWLWMANRNIEALDKLVDPNAMFVHMGATMDKSQELKSSSRAASNTSMRTFRRYPRAPSATPSSS